MEETDVEARLENFGKEISKLKQKASDARGIEKIEEMESRQKAFGERLTLLKSRAGTSWQNAKLDFHELANELTDAFEELVSWTDSDYESNHGR